jgi:hypothetical protein
VGINIRLTFVLNLKVKIMSYIYKVDSGTLNGFTKEFNLSARFFTSKKKALQEMNDILRINSAKNIVDSFEGYKALNDSYIKAVDYDGEEGKYKGRVLVEKVQIY